MYRGDTTLTRNIQLQIHETEARSEAPRTAKIKINSMDFIMQGMGFMVSEGELLETGDDNLCYVGVSKKRNGSMGLSMQMIILPPNCSHLLDAFQGELAVYVVSGHAEHNLGEGHRVLSGAGDFIYVAPGVCAQTYNVSNTEPLVLIVSQNSILPCAAVAVNHLYAA